MGFLNKIFSVLGFEDNEAIPQEEKQKKVRKKKTPRISSSYNLSGKGSKQKEQLQTIHIKTEEDLPTFVEKLKKAGAMILNLVNFDKQKRIRAFDFVSGAVFALDGQVKKLDAYTYLCVLDENSFVLEEE